MNDDLNYIAPDLYLVYASVEQGYANSLEDPTENDEMDW